MSINVVGNYLNHFTVLLIIQYFQLTFMISNIEDYKNLIFVLFFFVFSQKGNQLLYQLNFLTF